MDQRIEAFLADVLALAGENPDAIREGVRVALAKCEAIFRLQEPDGETAPQFDFGGEAIIKATSASREGEGSVSRRRPRAGMKDQCHE